MITLAISLRNSRLAVIGNALDSAIRPGMLRIYSAPRPAIGEALTEQILLVEIRLLKPSVLSIHAGALTFAPIGQALCRRSGQAAWARLVNGDEQWVADLDVGEVDSGAEVELSKLKLLAGGAVDVQLAQISE